MSTKVTPLDRAHDALRMRRFIRRRWLRNNYLQASTVMAVKMTWYRAAILSSAIVIALGMAGCGGDSTGRVASPFVTTGGASGSGLQDVTFTADLFTQRMSFNAIGAPDHTTGQFNFTGVTS